GESGKRLTRYRITLVPRLAYLQHATNQRIFQHKTVPQIITEVLKGHGIFTDSFRFQLREEGPERVYCTSTAKPICTSFNACAKRKASTTISSTAPKAI